VHQGVPISCSPLPQSVMPAVTALTVVPQRVTVCWHAHCDWSQVVTYMGMSGEPDNSREHKPLVLLLAGMAAAVHGIARQDYLYVIMKCTNLRIVNPRAPGLTQP
jgi:hypothetical protein